MRIAPWNSGIFDFVSIEVTFNDESRKTWDYDASYFNSMAQVLANMSADFPEPLQDYKQIVLLVKNGDTFHTGVIPNTELTGMDFSHYIFNEVKEVGQWQQAVIS